MKRIILTESQYKRLVKKRLNEQEVVFNNPKDEFDITNQMMQLLIHLKFYVDSIANKSLYIDKVENGIIYIDSTKYTKEEKDLINGEIDRWVSFTNISNDKRTKDLTYDFGTDTDWEDLHPNQDVAVVDNNNNSATDDVDLENDSATDDVDLEDEGTAEIDYDPNKKYSRTEYIALIKDIAISQMKKHKIPASITIAQAILESGDGNSGLARKGKNHFGIKCHSSWSGEKIYLDTREENNDGSSRTEKKACFRKYPNISLSFDDHSKFLKDNSRYDSLFDLGTTDYKGWAQGLQRAGYATSSTYAKTLISIIERYNLNKYDTQTSTAGCTLTSSDVRYFNENITNNEDNLNFRYWVNQDSSRLEKVNKRLSECGLPDPKLDSNGTINEHLRNAFALLGKDWVNAGKPKRPEESIDDSDDSGRDYNKNGKLLSSELTQVMNDVKGQTEYLSNAAAIQFKKMVADAKNDGVKITLTDGYRICGNPGDYERNQWSQWYAWEDKKFHNGPDAASPVPNTKSKWVEQGGGYCTSNHGFGNAIDVANGKDWIRTNGEKYGWYWGEARSESWHFTFCGEGVVNRPKFCKKKVKTEVPKKTEEPKGSKTVDAPTIVGNNSYILGKSIVVDKNGPKNHASRSLGNWQSDNATDIFGTPGTTVYSITKGFVSKIGGNDEDHTGKIYGGSITVKGKDGYTDIFYTHLQKIKVVKGQEVTLGTPLAEISLWETSPKGSHVHVGLPYGTNLNSLLNLDTGKIK